jgi:hypothetical protein
MTFVTELFDIKLRQTYVMNPILYILFHFTPKLINTGSVLPIQVYFIFIYRVSQKDVYTL